jgi:hypothetical protein
MAKIVTIVVVLHCVLLATTLYLWRRNPKSITVDFGFGFVVIEVAAIWLLMRLADLGDTRASWLPVQGQR